MEGSTIFYGSFVQFALLSLMVLAAMKTIHNMRSTTVACTAHLGIIPILDMSNCKISINVLDFNDLLDVRKTG